MKRMLFVLVALLSAVETSTAATFLFTMANSSPSEIRFFVRSAEVEGSTRVPSGAKREVKVTLPEGKCRAEIHIDFLSSNYLDDDKAIDFCKFGGLTVS